MIRLPRTLPELWVFLGIALPVLGSLLAPLSSTDLTYHLRAGADVLEGRIPTADTWTFTVPGAPWFDQQWLAQGILAGVWQVGGWTGLAVLRAALIALALVFVTAAIRARNPGLGPRTVSLLLLAIFVVSAVALGLRPQLLGLVLFAATLWALERQRAVGGGVVWLVPVLAIAWANVHGSFILAPVLVGLAILEAFPGGGRRVVALLSVLVATLAATLVNPAGLGVWSYAISLGLDPEITRRVTEWQPTTLRDVPGLLFWGSLAAVAVLVARRRAVTPWSALVALGLFAALGAYALRGVAWWPVVAAVVIAGLLPAEPAPALPPRRSAGPAAIALLIGAALIAALPAWRPVDPGLGAPTGLVSQAPPGITGALRSIVREGDRIWNPQPWGSWFEWTLPAATVAMDSRIELFPARIWLEREVVATAWRLDGEDWAAILDRYGVTIIVVAGQAEAALESALEAAPAWASVYEDDDGSVWLRTNRPIASRLPASASPAMDQQVPGSPFTLTP